MLYVYDFSEAKIIPILTLIFFLARYTSIFYLDDWNGWRINTYLYIRSEPVDVLGDLYVGYLGLGELSLVLTHVVIL